MDVHDVHNELNSLGKKFARRLLIGRLLQTFVISREEINCELRYGFNSLVLCGCVGWIIEAINCIHGIFRVYLWGWDTHACMSMGGHGMGSLLLKAQTWRIKPH